MSIKDYLERKLKKHASFSVYSPTNIPLDITTEDYILREGTTPLSFDMDCEAWKSTVSSLVCVPSLPTKEEPI